LRQRVAQLEAAAVSRTAVAPEQHHPSSAQRAAQPASHIKAMAPSSFGGGVGVNPEQWLREMERYLGVTGAAG